MKNKKIFNLYLLIAILNLIASVLIILNENTTILKIASALFFINFLINTILYIQKYNNKI